MFSTRYAGRADTYPGNIVSEIRPHPIFTRTGDRYLMKKEDFINRLNASRREHRYTIF